MIDIGNPNIKVDDHGVLLEDLEIKSGAKKEAEYDDPRIIAIAHDAFATTGIERLYAPYVKEIGEKAFYACKSLRYASVPGAEKIGMNAFAYCAALKNFEGGDNLSYLGRYALNSSGIELADLSGSQLKEIEPSAFTGCKSLGIVTLPDSLEHIGDSAFYGCEKLWQTDFPSALRSIGTTAFAKCKSLESFEPQGDALLQIGRRAFEGCESLKDIHIPASAEYVGRDAFFNVSPMAKIVCDSTKYKEWDKSPDSAGWSGNAPVIAPGAKSPKEVAEKAKEVVSAAFGEMRAMVNEYYKDPQEDFNLWIKIKSVTPLGFKRTGFAGGRPALGVEVLCEPIELDAYLHPSPLFGLHGHDNKGSYYYAKLPPLAKYGTDMYSAGLTIQDKMGKEAADVAEIRYEEDLVEDEDPTKHFGYFGHTSPKLTVWVYAD